MKSVGTKKLGKLSQHFTSQNHFDALRDFAAFMNSRGYIDTLLDASRRRELIKESQDTKFNTRIVTTLICDVVRTMSIQDLAFRGDSEETSNFFR